MHLYLEFGSPAVAAVFDAYPQALQKQLLALRQLIFETAAKTPHVGALQETLKWGQPSYLNRQPNTGTTLRIDQLRTRAGYYGIYFHCQTTLVDTFKTLFPNTFRYEGSRAIIFHQDETVPTQALSHCIAWALTYHLNQKRV